MPAGKSVATSVTAEARIPVVREVSEQVPPYCPIKPNVLPLKPLAAWKNDETFENVDWSKTDDIDTSPYEFWTQLPGVEWKRPSQAWAREEVSLVNENISKVDVFDISIPQAREPDLLLPKRSEFFEFFSQITILCRLTKSFEVDHRLLWNSLEPKCIHEVEDHCKYYVRVFMDGCWRKLAVDDTLPFIDGQCLFPILIQNGKICLWLTLLFKAKLWIKSTYGKNSQYNNMLYWTQAWLPAKKHDQATEEIKKHMHAPKNIDWSSLQDPNIEEFRFLSWEDFESKRADAEIAGDEESLKLLDQAKEDEIQTDISQNLDKQTKSVKKKEGMLPINRVSYMKECETRKSYHLRLKSEFENSQSHLIIFGGNKSCSVYAHVREKIDSSADGPRDLLLGSFSSEEWVKQKVDIAPGTSLVVSEYFIPEDENREDELQQTQTQQPLVRLSGITGCSTNAFPNLSLEQTFWISFSSLYYILSEGSVSAEVWLNPSIAYGKYNAVLSEHLSWSENFPGCWTKPSQTNTMCMYLKVPIDDYENQTSKTDPIESKVNSSVETIQHKKALLFFKPNVVQDAEDPGKSLCRIIKATREQCIQFSQTLFLHDNESFCLDSENPCLEINLIPNTPYLIQFDAPSGASLSTFSSDEVFIESITNAYISCFETLVHHQEGSGSFSSPVLANEWHIIARYRISTEDNTETKIAGTFTLDDAKVSPLVDIILLDNLTGCMRKINNSLLMEYQWISPTDVSGECDIIIILKAKEENIPQSGWNLKIISNRQLKKFHQIDVSANHIFKMRYLPNRNLILFREKVTTPEVGCAFSLRLALNVPKLKVKLQVLRPQSITENDISSGSHLGVCDFDEASLIYETTENVLHWIPREYQCEVFILQGVIDSTEDIRNIPVSDAPYWDTEQIPLDPIFGETKTTEEETIALEYTLFTATASPGVQLCRDTHWEEQFRIFRSSWEERSANRSKQAFATRLRFLGEVEKAEAVFKLPQDVEGAELYKKRESRTRALGNVSNDPGTITLGLCPIPKTEEELHCLESFKPHEGAEPTADHDTKTAEDFEKMLLDMQEQNRKTFMSFCLGDEVDDAI